MVHAACIFRSTLMAYSSSTVIFGEQLFDFPIPLFGANTKLKILFGDRIPVLVIVRETPLRESFNRWAYLVDHHYGKKIAYCREEQSVKVMLCGIANRTTENIEDHLTNDKEEHPETNVSKRPSIL